MGFDTIHETSVADFMDIIKTGIRAVDGIGSGGRSVSKLSSISKASKGLILEFPVLVSKANNIESAGIVAKAYEAKFVTMLQIVFSACNITHAKDGFDYLKNFHTNLDFDKITVDKFLDVMDGIVKESSTMSADSYAKYKAVTEDMRNLCFYFDDDIKESSLNNYKVMKNYGSLKVVKEMDLHSDGKDKHNNINNNAEDQRLDISRQTLDLNKDKFEDDKARKNALEKRDLEKFYFEKQKYDDDKNRQNTRDTRDTEKLNLDKDKFGYSKDQDAKRNELDQSKFRQNFFQNQLVSSDVKKANELTPTMVIVNFINDSNATSTIAQQMIIGVKAKLYEVEPTDVINKIITKNVDSNIILKLVKVSTREVSFVKDFLLAIDDAKLDALSKSRRGSANKLFKVLERRALKGKIRQSLRLNDYSKAISSLVISQEEAEELLKNNIDVNDPRIIRPIMEKLNLISFAIIDESSESVKFLFDTGDDVYETIPLSKLERDQKDGMSKKVINLMAKMNR